jgi:hypothetical protein
MGTGRSRSAAATFASVLAIALLCGQQPSEGLEHHSGIWRVLRAGHFSGPMNEGSHVQAIKGSISAQGKRYKFWEYSWESKENSHGGNALLVFEGADKALSYLGSYQFDAYPFHGRVHPEIRGKTVFFPYKDYEILGIKIPKEISFENGPPAKARVGDESGGEFVR